jgi:hypothetical protein
MSRGGSTTGVPPRPVDRFANLGSGILWLPRWPVWASMIIWRMSMVGTSVCTQATWWWAHTATGMPRISTRVTCRPPGSR